MTGLPCFRANSSSPQEEKLLAAKMMGRWRSGAPLALSPECDDLSLGADATRNNDFMYGDDPLGLKTPTCVSRIADFLRNQVIRHTHARRPHLGRHRQNSDALSLGRRTIVDDALWAVARAVSDQAKVLRRIPEKMDPALYYKTFRPYIRFFENVFYEATEQRPIADSDPHAPAMVRMNFRGETGAQSSIMPTLVAFMKIPHRPSRLTNHLTDMRNYMPAEHRRAIEDAEAMPSIRDLADRQAYNAVLEAIADFREVHYGWAEEYINRWTEDPRGTGGTPYIEWLRLLIEEPRAFKIGYVTRC